MEDIDGGYTCPTECDFHSHHDSNSTWNLNNWENSWLHLLHAKNQQPKTQLQHSVCVSNRVWKTSRRSSSLARHLKNMQQYDKDEEIQNHIQSLLLIMNKKRATVLLALFLLSKYPQNYHFDID